MKYHLYSSIREWVNASPAPGIAQPSRPLILRGVSPLMVGSLYCSMNVELIMGTGAPVSNIFRVWKAFCLGTEMYIMTIGRTPDCCGVL
jgi:hypothetical protein